MPLLSAGMQADSADEPLELEVKRDLGSPLNDFSSSSPTATPLLYSNEQHSYTEHFHHSAHLSNTLFGFTSDDSELIFHDNLDLQDSGAESLLLNGSGVEAYRLSRNCTPSGSHIVDVKSSDRSSDDFNVFDDHSADVVEHDGVRFKSFEGRNDRSGHSEETSRNAHLEFVTETVDVMESSKAAIKETGMREPGATKKEESSENMDAGEGVSSVMNVVDLTSAGVSGMGTVMDVVMARGCDRRKGRLWRNVGWFNNEHSMNEVRKRQRVSKWKSVTQVDGLKVFFRCNRWKRTSCNYRMYVMYYSMDRISLNESGEHDHSTPNVNYKPRSHLKSLLRRGARAVIEATPSSSQQQALDQLILNATSRPGSLYLGGSFPHDNSRSASSFDSGPMPSSSSGAQSRNLGDFVEAEDAQEGPYQLNDGQNIAELLQVAADMDLTFTFNSRRTCEYCFESNVPEMKGRMVVFSDLGEKVYIKERHHGVDQNGEEWKKADWNQFLWAVRGKCMNALKGI